MGLKTDIILSRRPLAGFVAIGLAWATYFAQMPVIKANVGASDGEYGFAILVSSLGAIMAMWLAPMFLRLFGSVASSISIAVIAVGMLGAGIAPSIPLLICGMAFAAVGSGVVDVLANARISEIEADARRSLMNLNHALYSFAYAGGALVTGALREAGWAPTSVFLLLACALVALAITARDPAVTLPESGAAGKIQTAAMHRLVLLAGLVVMMAFLAEAASEGWSALHLERTLGGTAGEGALGPALLGLTMGIGRLFGHGLARVIRDTTLMLLATVVSASGILLAGVAGSVPMALAGFALAGLGISVVASLSLALIGRVVPPAQRLAAISRASVIGYGAFFFGPSLMGLVAEGFGLRMAFVLVAALLAATALILVPMLARRSA
ncbi:putative MFS-type transporter [Sulfitobacter noctilucicola]|uniref:MFS family permease n=1 Tax=Sulfitobacter noctilucicola TaxID=1342301 RepID=A0A7W6M9R3_9RHOB|nr:MFS transporter [Sulfitobacter noctilucicola]KIN63727.1 putative MFS-type transporter [Sulfitobacter noctilucicola]MBB4174762.1 MFS family permease [Sulfitobacter noctilucicola]